MQASWKVCWRIDPWDWLSSAYYYYWHAQHSNCSDAPNKVVLPPLFNTNLGMASGVSLKLSMDPFHQHFTGNFRRVSSARFREWIASLVGFRNHQVEMVPTNGGDVSVILLVDFLIGRFQVSFLPLFSWADTYYLEDYSLHCRFMNHCSFLLLPVLFTL